MQRRSFLATVAAAVAGLFTRKLKSKRSPVGWQADWRGVDVGLKLDRQKNYLLLIDHSGEYHMIPYDTECKAVGFTDAEA